MEVSQLEQMIRWLDEERKRDKTAYCHLQEKLEQQTQLIQSQRTEITSAQQKIASLQTEIRRTDDYPGMIEKTNRDLTAYLDELRAQVRRERLENEQVRHAEIETLNDMIADLDKKIRPYARYEEQLAARAAGEQRIQGQVQTITNDLADLGKRTEDRLQSIVYLEEQRRADARRIIAVEGDLPPLRKASMISALNLSAWRTTSGKYLPVLMKRLSSPVLMNRELKNYALQIFNENKKLNNTLTRQKKLMPKL